jgi:hypothetical protein
MDSIDSLDAQIRELELSMELDGNSKDVMETSRALKTQRNALTPFVALAEDIIIEVATYLLVEPSPSLLPWYFQQSPVHSILNLCREVRRVLTGTPLLWLHIDLRRSIRWCELCVGRAGSAPLSLSCCPPHLTRERCWSDARKTEVARLLLELLPRAARVFVRAPRWSLPEGVVSALFESPWPLIQALEFRTSPDGLELSTHPQSFSFLRALYLADASLLGDDVQFPLLQHLETSGIVCDSRFGGAEQLSPTLRIVDKAPALRSLVMHGYNPCFRDSHLLAELDTRTPRSLDMLRVIPLYVEEEHSGWAPLLAFLRAFRAPHKECAVSFAREYEEGESIGAWAAALMETAMPNCTMHIRRLPSLARAHRVTFVDDVAGTRWAVGVDHCEDPINLPEDMLVQVKTLRVGADAAADLFRDAASHAAPDALPSAQDVIIEDAQSDLTYLRQWLHARILAGRRVRTVKFCASLVYPDARALAVLKRDIVEMKLAKVVIWEDGEVCVVPEG